MKYTYSTFVNKKGTWRVRHWTQEFTDDSTGKKIKIKREEPIKLNGEKIIFYPQSVIDKMSPAQRKEVLI